jgi:hypothetical protein
MKCNQTNGGLAGVAGLVGVAVNARRPFMVRGKWMILGLAIVLAGSYGWAKEEGKEEAKAKVELPDAVAKTVADAFPGAKIEDVKAEDEYGVQVFEIELKMDKQEIEIEVASCGTIIEVETEIQMKDVPDAAAKAIMAAAEGGKVDEVKKVEARAEIKGGKVAKFDAVKITYEAEIKKGDQKGEIEVAADGTVVEPLKWKDKCKEERKDENGDCKKEC